MEAKDTVMERWRVNIFWRKIGVGCEIPSYADYGEEHPTYRLLQAQAEISFKAGIKYAVDWIHNQEGAMGRNGRYVHLGLGWQAQLKGWGIKEEHE